MRPENATAHTGERWQQLYKFNNNITMKQFLLLSAFLISLLSCEKENNNDMKSQLIVSVDSATNIGYYDAILHGEIKNLDSEEIYDYGLVWSIETSPTTNDTDKIYFGPTKNDSKFESTITNLEPSTTYFFRSFAITKTGINYSGELSFVTQKMPWSEIDEFGGAARMWAIAFSIGEKGYIGLGQGEGNIFLNDFWEYDSKTKAWTRKADFPGGPRIDAVGFSIGNKGYVGTGLNNDYQGTSDFWEYDPLNDKWTQKTDYAGGPIEFATGFSIGDKGYIGIGTRRSIGQQVREFYEYNATTDEWSKKRDFPGTAVDKTFNFTINNRGYVGIGETPLGYSNEFWEYNPSTNQWSQKQDFQGNAGCYANGFSVNNIGYVCLGRYGSNEVWKYNSLKDQWTQYIDFPGQSRECTTSFTINNISYLGTGSTGFVYLKDFWTFSPFNK